jgi:predicted RNA methylase
MSAKGNGASSITADHYPTPPSLVTRLVEASGPIGARVHDANKGSGFTFLDIGAGEGAISAELIRLGVSPSRITAIELRPECRPALDALGVEVVIADALALPVAMLGRDWDVAIYNPPFGLWDRLRAYYRDRARHLYAVGRAGMAAGAQERAAVWREDQPDVYEVPERVSFVRLEYRDDATGEVLASGGQDAAGTAWFHWGPMTQTDGRRLTLRDRTPEECEHRPPTRRVYVSRADWEKSGKKAKPAREEMVNGDGVNAAEQAAKRAREDAAVTP